VEDFRNSAVVQPGLGGDVSRRKACLPGSLEAFAARSAGLVALLLSALERRLEAAEVGSGVLLGGIHDCGSLRVLAAFSWWKRPQGKGIPAK